MAFPALILLEAWALKLHGQAKPGRVWGSWGMCFSKTVFIGIVVGSSELVGTLAHYALQLPIWFLYLLDEQDMI